MLQALDNKCEKFLDKVSDRLEPVCELLSNYPSLAICVILTTMIVLTVFLFYSLGGE